MPVDFQALAEQLPALESPDFAHGTWAGGTESADGSLSMPYFEYSDEALAVIRSMPIEVFDWTAWMATDEARDLLADYSRIATATPEQLRKLTTALVRGDRFNEGTLAWAFESGLITAIARRAADLVAS